MYMKQRTNFRQNMQMHNSLTAGIFTREGWLELEPREELSFSPDAETRTQRFKTNKVNVQLTIFYVRLYCNIYLQYFLTVLVKCKGEILRLELLEVLELEILISNLKFKMSLTIVEQTQFNIIVFSYFFFILIYLYKLFAYLFF